VACWPREQADRRRLLGGDGATAVEVTGKEAREGRRTTEKVMPCLVRTEEGWSGGSSSGSELGGGIHGGRALAHACSAEGEGGGEQGEQRGE